MQRRFVNWSDDVGYDLEIGRQGGRQSFVSWRLKAISDDQYVFRITIFPHVLQDLPDLFRWIPFQVYIKPQLKKYLESVIKGFAWYIRTEEPVPKNNFGYHAWFSPKRGAKNYEGE
jgi:hypothetical protein